MILKSVNPRSSITRLSRSTVAPTDLRLRLVVAEECAPSDIRNPSLANPIDAGRGGSSLHRRDRGCRRPDDSGQSQRRRGQEEAAPVVLAQPRRELVQVPHLAERNAQLEQAQIV